MGFKFIVNLINFINRFSILLSAFSNHQFTMGCVHDKQLQNPNARNSQVRTSTENPEILAQSVNFKSQPNLEVAKQACGYEFTKSTSRTQEGLRSPSSSRQKGSLLDKLLDDFQQCQYYYSEHNIDRAQEYAIQFEQKYRKYARSKQASRVVEESKDQYFSLINQVHQEYRDVIAFEQEIGQGSWVQKSNKKGVKISTRREQTTVGVLIQGEIAQPFEIFISILIEMDLYKHFTPFMKVSRQEKIVARNCRIGFTESHFPILSVREAFFQGIGYNRLQKNNTLFLMTRSLHNREDLQQKLGYKCNVNPKHIQLEYKYFLLTYQPICHGRGKIRLAINVDTKMDYIPMWIQDKISQDFGNDFYHNLLKLSKNFKGSQWQRNVKANPTLFNFFKEEIDKHLNKQLK